MFRKILGLTLLSTFPLATQAANLAVEKMTITGGSVVFYDPNYGIAGCGANLAWVCLTPGHAAMIDDGIASDGAMDADGLWGDPTNPVFSAAWFQDKLLLGFFAHSGSPGYPIDPDPNALTATVDTVAGTISADFSGFFLHWDGTSILVGGTAAGQVSPITVNADGTGYYDYLLSWTAPAYGTVFSLPTIHVNLTGTLVTAVPEPHARAMMLAGLGLIWAVARRRQKSATVPAPV